MQHHMSFPQVDGCPCQKVQTFQKSFAEDLHFQDSCGTMKLLRQAGIVTHTWPGELVVKPYKNALNNSRRNYFG